MGKEETLETSTIKKSRLIQGGEYDEKNLS
jgi:hypothetical protein